MWILTQRPLIFLTINGVAVYASFHSIRFRGVSVRPRNADYVYSFCVITTWRYIHSWWIISEHSPFRTQWIEKKIRWRKKKRNRKIIHIRYVIILCFDAIAFYDLWSHCLWVCSCFFFWMVYFFDSFEMNSPFYHCLFVCLNRYMIDKAKNQRDDARMYVRAVTIKSNQTTYVDRKKNIPNNQPNKSVLFHLIHVLGCVESSKSDHSSSDVVPKANWA